MANPAIGSEPTVGHHFVGRTHHVRETYDAILDAAAAIGPVREDPKKTSTHLVRRTAFAETARLDRGCVRDRGVAGSRVLGVEPR